MKQTNPIIPISEATCKKQDYDKCLIPQYFLHHIQLILISVSIQFQLLDYFLLFQLTAYNI